MAATVLLLSHLELPSVANPRLAPLPLISFAWSLLRLLSASPCSPFANTLDIRTSRIRPAHLLVSTLPPCLVFPQPSPYFATVLCSHRLPLPSVPARTQNLTKHPCHAPRAFWAPRAPNAPPSLTCLAPIASARRLFILTRLLHPRSYRPPRVAPRSTSITLEPTLLLTHSLPLALSLARSPLARLGVRTHPSPHRLATSRSRAGARTGLQLPGHGDMQGFNSSSPASRSCVVSATRKKPPVGFEPTTSRLLSGCSAN